MDRDAYEASYALGYAIGVLQARLMGAAAVERLGKRWAQLREWGVIPYETTKEQRAALRLLEEAIALLQPPREEAQLTLPLSGSAEVL
jgi:hypothetical protein